MIKAAGIGTEKFCFFQSFCNSLLRKSLNLGSKLDEKMTCTVKEVGLSHRFTENYHSPVVPFSFMNCFSIFQFFVFFLFLFMDPTIQLIQSQHPHQYASSNR